MERFMNIDVVAQVAQWLEPRDLLRFAVINKTTWNFLLRMKAIWRKSREDFSLRNKMVCQLPECPPDLTEIQYTSMIFGPPSKCSVKLCRSDKTTVFLEARLQLCNECLVNTYFFMQEAFLKDIKRTPYELRQDDRLWEDLGRRHELDTGKWFAHKPKDQTELKNKPKTFADACYEYFVEFYDRQKKAAPKSQQEITECTSFVTKFYGTEIWAPDYP